MLSTAHHHTSGRTRLQSGLLVIAIVLFGFFVRTINVNWDQNQHLHPDERFLTMVMGEMKIPSTISTYLNPDVSTFNPPNVGFGFYVYGIFPLVINKVFAMALHLDDYINLTLQGRYLSAVMDTTMILLVILITQQFEKKYSFSRNVKYFAGLLYAIAVLPIQQSHFFTVDTFANTFFFLSFLWALKVDEKHFIRKTIISGCFFGLAVASKINVILGGPIIGWLVVDTFFAEFIPHKKYKQLIVSVLLATFFWFVSFWIALRLAGPYYFAQFSLIDFRLNSQFVHNIQSLQSMTDPNSFFPPSIQWIGKTPIIFPLVNISVWGLGLPIFFFAIYGWGKLTIFAVKKWRKRVGLVFLFLWMIIFFVYQGVQFVTTLRYFLLLYPLAAIGAAYGINEIGHRSAKKVSLSIFQHQRVVVICSLICLIWPMMFISVYLQKHTRLQASDWMYRVLPTGSQIALEHWDDPLPLIADDMNAEKKVFVGKQLPVFYQDTDEKWKEMDKILAESDYYVLTSNRGWGSILVLPDKYPRMSQFYQDLFAGKTQFEKVAEFTSYPSLQYFGIPITVDDDWSEEAFTVYDHPKVMIFAKKPSVEAVPSQE